MIGRPGNFQCDVMVEQLPPVEEVLGWIPALQMDNCKNDRSKKNNSRNRVLHSNHGPDVHCMVILSSFFPLICKMRARNHTTCHFGPEKPFTSHRALRMLFLTLWPTLIHLTLARVTKESHWWLEEEALENSIGLAKHSPREQAWPDKPGCLAQCLDRPQVHFLKDVYAAS